MAMSTGEKVLAWGLGGVTAVLVTFGIIEAAKASPAPSGGGGAQPASSQAPQALPAAAAQPFTLLTASNGIFPLKDTETYLVQELPVSGQTLAQTIAALQALYPQMTVLASYDVGVIPSVLHWPTSDTGVIGMVVTINFPAPPPNTPKGVFLINAVPLKAITGTKVWTTGGAAS
jgi:hypothetical protein